MRWSRIWEHLPEDLKGDGVRLLDDVVGRKVSLVAHGGDLRAHHASRTNRLVEEAEVGAAGGLGTGFEQMTRALMRSQAGMTILGGNYQVVASGWSVNVVVELVV
jgi:hypothetical protein